jgi:hypothetical protein
MKHEKCLRCNESHEWECQPVETESLTDKVLRVVCNECRNNIDAMDEEAFRTEVIGLGSRYKEACLNK